MPGQDYRSPNPMDGAALANAFFGNREQDGLAAEVAALRVEIAALRAELAPVPSLILTGQSVVAEFRRLRDLQMPRNMHR